MAFTAAREIGNSCVSVFSFVPGIVDTPLVHEVIIPQVAAALGIPEEQVMPIIAHNPGYTGLMPVDHCATAFAYAIVRAPEYHGQIPIRRRCVTWSDDPKKASRSLRSCTPPIPRPCRFDCGVPTMTSVKVLLVSTYELGHQPLHVASPAGALRRAGHQVRCVDLSVEMLEQSVCDWAEAVAFSVPMHTAMRLAVQMARELRAAYTGLPICFYGLYAAVGRDRTVGSVADRVIAGEYEPALVAWIDELDGGTAAREPVRIELGRTRFHLPARDLLPPLHPYAHLEVAGEHRLVGYVEASHGCRHRCRHCPIPTIYDGRFRIVDQEVLLADVAQLVEMGAQHITFGDPDFLNGVHHSMRVVRAMHARFPDLTFDITAKVEHLLAHPDLWTELREAGLLFVVSAFETTNDETLRLLDKGHTVADEVEAIELLRRSGVEIRPSWLPFTPWTTADDLADILESISQHDLDVDPVQLTIRLLIPEGSLVLDVPEILPYLDSYDPELLTWRWHSADPEVDLLQARLADLVEEGVERGVDNFSLLQSIGREIEEATGRPVDGIPAGSTEGRPRLTEPWFC